MSLLRRVVVWVQREVAYLRSGSRKGPQLLL